jgi:hypothetical protein
MVSTEEAARALGYRSASALLMQCQRHPALMKHSEKRGRVRVWNLADLKAAYAQNGWQPR